jgi:hypothetical protein
VSRNELVVDLWCDGEFWQINQPWQIHLYAQYSPWWEKSNKLGSSLLPLFVWRESGSLVLGSLSSSKNGCTIASIAERRCVGVYSSNLEIKSIAF